MLRMARPTIAYPGTWNGANPDRTDSEQRWLPMITQSGVARRGEMYAGQAHTTDAP